MSWLRSVCVVFASLSLLAACGGGGGDSTSNEPPASTPEPVPTSGPRPEPTAAPAPTAQPEPTADPRPEPTPESSLNDLRLVRIASDLDAPLYVTSAPGDAASLFIVERVGRVRIWRDGRVLDDSFLDLTDVVRSGGELGLLGLAFHPDYEENGLFYVNYTDDDLMSVTAEFEVHSDDPDRADRDSERVLLGVPQDTINHHGGMLVFGPDGALYLSLGDSAQGADPRGYAQDEAEFRGKILRFDPLIFPEPLGDNPGFANPHVWHLGLRNPWRFSFDRETGDLYIADVGELEAEEVNVVAAGVGGLNFGWNVTEGAQCFLPPWLEEPRPICDAERFQLPVFSYGRDMGCSITGGYAYRGVGVPPLVGRYVYADFCSNRVFSFVWRDGQATDYRELSGALESRETLQSPTSFGEDAEGNLYVTDLGGAVYRIEAR